MRSAVAIHGASLATTLAASLVISLAAGCGDMELPEPGGIELEVGSAAPDGAGYLAVEDGTEVVLVPGAQGGFHVWLGMRVRGGAGRLWIEREARRVSDGALVYRGLRQVLDLPDEAQDAWWESPLAAPAFMCPSPVGIQVFDEDLRLTARIIDEDDQVVATDEVILMPRCPTGEQEAFCYEICAG